jgi:hypothetical protein
MSGVSSLLVYQVITLMVLVGTIGYICTTFTNYQEVLRKDGEVVDY